MKLADYLATHPKAHADFKATPQACHLYPNGEQTQLLYNLEDYHVGSSNGAWLFLGPGPALLRMNSLDTYTKTGAAAGLAMRRRDSALASSHHDWLSRALRLEKEPYRTEAREAYNAAYREEARR